MKLLVVWFSFTVNGSISRFVNTQKYMKSLGHDVEFCSLTNDKNTAWDINVLSYDEALENAWDAVMIPGAGADRNFLSMFDVLKNDCFGKRIQFLLNDYSRYPKFKMCNEYLKPDMIIVNNTHWTTDQLRSFSYGDLIGVLPGAIDQHLFLPGKYYSDPFERNPKLIGGHYTKNPNPLIKGFLKLEDNYLLKFFGTHVLQNSHPRIQSSGRIFGKDLVNYYNSIDIMVTTEPVAGWCNPAAEAMACKIPTICSKHGTIDFAVHEENALVLEEISERCIMENIKRLMSDKALYTRIKENSDLLLREQYSWEKYCEKLIYIINQGKE